MKKELYELAVELSNDILNGEKTLSEVNEYVKKNIPYSEYEYLLTYLKKINDLMWEKENWNTSKYTDSRIYPLNCLPNGIEEEVIDEVEDMICENIPHRMIYNKMMNEYGLSEMLSTYIVDEATSRLQMEMIDNSELKERVLEEKENGTWWKSLDEFYDEYEEMCKIKDCLENITLPIIEKEMNDED